MRYFRLVLDGVQDRFYPPPDLSRQSFYVLNTGHLIGVEQPRAVNKLILDFFAKP